jgi:hypothetical protein
LKIQLFLLLYLFGFETCSQTPQNNTIEKNKKQTYQRQVNPDKQIYNIADKNIDNQPNHDRQMNPNNIETINKTEGVNLNNQKKHQLPVSSALFLKMRNPSSINKINKNQQSPSIKVKKKGTLIKNRSIENSNGDPVSRKINEK